MCDDLELWKLPDEEELILEEIEQLRGRRYEIEMQLEMLNALHDELLEILRKKQFTYVYNYDKMAIEKEEIDHAIYNRKRRANI